MQLYGYVSAQIKRIHYFLESASFIGCQANKALVAETSAVKKKMGKKRDRKARNRDRKQACSRLDLTKFMPIPTASCGQACWQDIFCRLSLSCWGWALDGVSSPSPFGAFNGRRTCLLQLAQWNSKGNEKHWYFKGTVCSESLVPALTDKSCPAPSESVSPASPARPNRECRRFPTRVGSVSAVCGMFSLRVSMQVGGRCATRGNQDVIFLP